MAQHKPNADLPNQKPKQGHRSGVKSQPNLYGKLQEAQAQLAAGDAGRTLNEVMKILRARLGKFT